MVIHVTQSHITEEHVTDCWISTSECYVTSAPNKEPYVTAIHFTELHIIKPQAAEPHVTEDFMS